MDDLSSCTALEQTLSGFKKDVEQTLTGIREDVDSLSTYIDSPLATLCSEEKERCPQCENGVYEIAPHLNNVMFFFTVYLRTAPWCPETRS